jgi:fibronectin type 3 domain-containing protein
MTRHAISVLCLAALFLAAPAQAWWAAGGAGGGTAATDVLPAGNQPTAAASVQTVTVRWTQTQFHGSPVGSYANGGYKVVRYPAAGGAAVAAGGTCTGTVSGSAATLSCQDTAVPIGSWRYTVQPVLGTWSGAESTQSASVITTVPAPVLNSASAQNPTAAQATGDVTLSWSAVSGASGYDVYRRIAAGSYDYTTPLNGATPVSGTTYTDAGGGLSGAGYAYVVRAVQPSPAAESPSSNELTVTPWTRPSAPSSVTATPQAAAAVAVTWAAVTGASGYDVYRRTSSGSYNFAAPLNGATPVSGTSFADTTASNGVSYLYVVRAVVSGAGGAPIESVSSVESSMATADGAPPPAPAGVTVGAGAGPLLSAATCAFAANTRFVNAAGASAVPVTVTVATPESGETVLLSASTPGSTAVTARIAATSTTVSTTLDLSSLADGAVTLTARTADALTNQSAAATAGSTVKDTTATLSGLAYTDNKATVADTLAGTSECGATITATQTAGTAVGSTYPAAGTFTVGAVGTFSGFAVGAIKGAAKTGTAYAYSVSATDLAGNSRTLSVSGTDLQ